MSWLETHPLLYQGAHFSLYTHGFFFALGALSSTLILGWWAKKCALNVEHLLTQILWIFGIGLLGARIGFFIIYPSTFQSIGQVLEIWQGGLVSYFGILSGLLTAYFIFRSQPEEKLRTWFDLLSLSALFGWSIGRIGNYYAGDAVGIKSMFWHVFYGRVPIQLFESILTLVLGIFLWIFYMHYSKRPGLGTYLALVGYLAGRFIIDFWRDEGLWWGFHFSQWTSLALLLACWVIFYVQRTRYTSKN